MKSNLKKRILAVVLCMVLMLSTGISTMADGEVAAGTPAPESGASQEPAAASVEGEAVEGDQTPAEEPLDSNESVQTQEETPTEPSTADNKDVPAAAENNVAGATELVGGGETQDEAPGQTTETETTEQEPEVVSEAVELKQEFTDEAGNVTQRVIANIPEGAFQANASEITMEVNYLDEAAENHVKELMTAALPENEILGDYILYDIKFKVNGEVTEPQKAIAITFEGSGLHIEDTKKANVFYIDPADPEVQDDKDEIVEITQKSEMIENLQNAGQSVENIDEYDLSEISVKEDGTADKILMDGRISTVYGCYVEELPEPVQTLTYEDEDVVVNVSADAEGIIPERASLKVVPILKNNEKTHEQYQEVEEQIQAKQAEENEENSIIGFLAYDITFVDDDGNKIEPNGNVNVTLEYKKEALPENVNPDDVKDADVTVFHLEEDNKGKVEDVVDLSENSQLKALDTTELQEVQKAEFVTDSFSYFTVTWIDSDDNKKKVQVYLVDSKTGKELSVTNDFEKNYNETFKNTENKPLAELGREYQRYLKNSSYTYLEGRLNSATGQVATNISYNNKWFYYNGAWKDWKSSGDKKVYLLYVIDKLTETPTVDSTAAGITMRMIDYETAANGLNNAIGGGYGEGETKGTIKKNLLNPVLEKDGYPVTSNGKTSLKSLFSGGRQVNHLFRQDIYEETGYYEYSSFENYAYLGYGNNFTVYDQIGTPSNSNAYYFQRGNFMPYNAIKSGAWSTANRNWYDEDGKRLPESNSRYNERLYKTQGENNYYFGMYLEANFLQPEEGKASHKGKKSPMRYEFNGDDDLWIYIDDVLVLDIGGIHDAHSGYIDFASGVVAWKDCKRGDTPVEYYTTIKEMFWRAQKFPDGTAWTNKNDKNVDKYFAEDTFKDFSIHSFKMFYMERGAEASNLHMKMNLPIIPEGSVEVKKELTNTDKEKYANVQFAFQVYAQEIKGKDEQGNETYGEDYVLLDSAVNPDTNEPIIFQNATFIDENGKEKKYEDVFFLKPDERAQFKDLQSNRKYYVVEIGVNAKEYDKVIINGVEYVILDKDGKPVNSKFNEIMTEEEAVGIGKVVLYQNSCSIYNRRELRITKRMAEGQTTTDTFAFKIWLTNQDNQLVPYVNGDYYLTDTHGNYYYYNDKGILISNGTNSKICGTSTNEGIISGVPQDYTISLTNILSGTSFKVEEVELSDDYLEYTKEMQGEYESSDVNGADGKILLGKVGIEEAHVVITNRKKLNTLHIKKTDAEESSTLLAGAEFKIEKQINANTWEYVQREDKDYTVTTNSEGEAIFSELENGTYRVTETKAPEGYVLDDSKKSFIVNLPYYEPDIANPQDSSISVVKDSNLESDYYYTITKTVTNDKVHWDIIKRSSSSKDLKLTDAEFLMQTQDKGVTYYGKSNEDGIVIWYLEKSEDSFKKPINKIAEGTYVFTETKAPIGYALSSESWIIDVGRNGSLISVKSNGIDVTDKLVEENGKMIHFYFENTAIYSLPSSGGSGIFWYMVGGILLMMTAALLLYKNKSREVLEK